MEDTLYTKKVSGALIVALVAIMISWFVIGALLLRTGTVRYHCTDPVPYSDLVAEYAAGATYLDGYPKDGIPCNEQQKVYLLSSKNTP